MTKLGQIKTLKYLLADNLKVRYKLQISWGLQHNWGKAR